MYITEIFSIPKFVNKYTLRDVNTSVLQYTHDFCEEILNNVHSYIETINATKTSGQQTLLHIPITEKSIKFLEFYFDKSKLDRYYNCKYENELNIPKSSNNESFSIQISYNNFKVHGILKDYNNEEVVMLIY